MAFTEHPQRAARFAIIGYAARLPGAADAEQYWDVLHNGQDAISEVPPDRWDADEFFDPDPAAPGTIVTRRAGFVDDVTGFAAGMRILIYRRTNLVTSTTRVIASVDNELDQITLAVALPTVSYPADGDTWFTYANYNTGTAAQDEHLFMNRGSFEA